MDRKPNHNCRICGTAYFACAQCDKMKNWRAFCDTPEHYQVFQVLLMYSRSIIDAEEAASQLANMGIAPGKMDNIIPQKVAEISAIFAEAYPPVQPIDYNCETDAPKTKKKTRRSDA